MVCSARFVQSVQSILCRVQCKMGRQRLWPLNPPTKMTQAMMTKQMIMSTMIADV